MKKLYTILISLLMIGNVYSQEIKLQIVRTNGGMVINALFPSKINASGLYCGEYSTNGIDWNRYGNILEVGNVPKDIKQIYGNKGPYTSIYRFSNPINRWNECPTNVPVCLFRLKTLYSNGW